MRKKTWLIFIVIFFSFVLLPISGSTAATNQPPKPNLQIQLEQIIKEIKLAIMRLEDTDESEPLPDLDSATVELKTQLTRAGDGNFKLFIAAIGGKVEESETQTMMVTLRPPPGKIRGGVESSEISENLAGAILSIARGVARVQSEKPDLELSELTASVKFVVTDAVKGSGGFAIVPVTIELGDKFSKSVTHSITLHFK
jgi:hypothetical protein